MKSPLVSVLIPLYNSEKYIVETVKSVLNQTWKNIEIIVVDDGSDDNSYAIAKVLESENVRVYKQKNKGACAARNYAFSVSKGEYIQYLDADDLISPKKIEVQIQRLLSSPPNSVASCGWGRFRESLSDFKPEEKKINRDYDLPIQWLIDSWNGFGSGSCSAWLTPRHLIEKAGPWDDELTINQDGEFFTRVLVETDYIRFCNDVWMYYRSNISNSVSKSYLSESKAKSLLKSYESYRRSVIPKFNTHAIRMALARNFCNFIYLYSPAYPHLVERANQNIKELAVDGMSSMGGSSFKTLARFVGFFNAIKFRNLLKL